MFYATQLLATYQYIVFQGLYVTQHTLSLLRDISMFKIIHFFFSLNPLFDVAYLPPNDIRIAQTLCFTADAQAMYMPSATEIQRLTCSEVNMLNFLSYFQLHIGHEYDYSIICAFLENDDWLMSRFSHIPALSRLI